jgi:hypothetical protein
LGRLRPTAWGLAWTLVVVVLLLRATAGLDLGDGTHHVGLALRLARGDAPFRDEMNLQVLGALPAVPFVWFWDTTVGSTGIILATRAWSVALSLFVGWVTYRLLRSHVTPGVAALAVLVALVPQPYNLVTLSYNTTPALLLLLAAVSGASSVLRPSPPRSVACGAAAVGAGFFYPVLGVAAVLTMLAVILLSRRLASVVWVAAGAMASLTAAALLLLAWDLGAVRETIRFTTAYQGLRVPPMERLEAAASHYVTVLSMNGVVAAAVCAALAAMLPHRSRTWPAGVLAVAVPTTVGLVAVRPSAPERGLPDQGMTSGVLGIVLTVVLVLPAIVMAVRGRDRVAGTLLVVGVIPALVQVPLVAATTSSSPVWGAPSVAIAPALLAVSVAVARALSTWGVAALAVSAAVLFAAHALQPYRDVPFWEGQTTWSGPTAGLVTGAGVADGWADLTTAVRSCPGGGDGVLAYSAPAVSVITEGRIDSNIIWLAPFGSANRTTVEWIERRGRAPQCVIVHRSAATRAPSGQWSTRVGKDPLLDWVALRYSVLASGDSSYVVLGSDAQ